MRRLFGTDGIRGIANDTLTCEVALQTGRALGGILSSHCNRRPTVLIGTDTRLSADMLCDALCAGVCSAGCDCHMLGVVPTPAVACLVREYRAEAGVMISASHNPYPYNGIKLFGKEGKKLSDESEERIESLVLGHAPPCCPVSADRIGSRREISGAPERYLDTLRKAVDSPLTGLRVAIDCANGSASRTAEELFSSLGVTCTMLADTPNGININEDCGSTHPEALAAFVRAHHLDAGIAFDGDADRCLAVDETGGVVDGDFILAILALGMKEKGTLRQNTVVGTVMTNFGFRKFCGANGIRYLAADVGDRYVSEAMDRGGYALGGEQSGHLIFRDYATTGDGQLTALLLLSRMMETGKPLSELCRVMKKYPQYTINLPATQNEKNAVRTDREISAVIDDARKSIGDRGRLLVRPSGTEPVVRIMAEGEDAEEIRQIAEQCAERIAERLEAY